MPKTVVTAAVREGENVDCAIMRAPETQGEKVPMRDKDADKTSLYKSAAAKLSYGEVDDTSDIQYAVIVASMSVSMSGPVVKD